MESDVLFDTSNNYALPATVKSSILSFVSVSRGLIPLLL